MLSDGYDPDRPDWTVQDALDAADAGDLDPARRIEAAAEVGTGVEQLRAVLVRDAALADSTPYSVRQWLAVLAGSILLEVAERGESGGRYAAAWHTAEHLMQLVYRLGIVLGQIDRALGAVTALPDRNSQVLAAVVARAFGLPLVDEPGGSKVTLVVAWHWPAPPGSESLELGPDAGSAKTLLWAHVLEWTSPRGIAPDIASCLAQGVVPPWGARLQVTDLPPGDASSQGRPQVQRIPPDQRAPADIADDLVLLNRQALDVRCADLDRTVHALAAVPGHVGAMGGRRGWYFGSGPTQSARFT